jgi:hypothetical protein
LDRLFQIADRTGNSQMNFHTRYACLNGLTKKITDCAPRHQAVT